MQWREPKGKVLAVLQIIEQRCMLIAHSGLIVVSDDPIFEDMWISQEYQPKLGTIIQNLKFNIF